MRIIYFKKDEKHVLGRAGENGATSITVDVAAWAAEYPSGTGALVYKRPDGQIYPLTATLDGDLLCAVLTNTETAVSGVARVEAQWIEGDVVVKSATYEGSIAASLGEAGSVPEASPSWVDDMTALGVTIAADKVSAAGSAADAQAAQIAAEQSATAAQASAAQIVTDESARVTAEQGRASAEQGRVTAEQGRVTAEQGRVTAEQGRVTAEEARGVELAAHVARTDNPHSVTAAQVGAYTRAEVDELLITSLTKDNYRDVMRAWFAANGAAIVGDLSTLLERWYSITRTGWCGGTRFWNTDQSQGTTGTKVGDNAGLTCAPSTIAQHNTDDYEGLPLFAVKDCNWYLDSNGKRHIRAIDGISSLYAYTKTNPAYPVGVLQMAPWIKQTQEDTTYTDWMADSKADDDYVPVSEAIDLDGTVHTWVVHSKYGMGDAYSSISGVPIRVWDVSHNSQRAAIWAAFGNMYCGKTSADDAWMKLHVYIKYASLTLDDIMSGCCSYYNNALKPAVAETGVKRVLVTASQASRLIVGSTVCVGSSTYGGKSTQCSVVDRAKIVSIETVEVDGVSYSALNLNVTDNFDTTTDLFITTMQWYTGSTDDVQGNDGSPYSNTSSKEPYKLQGIEQSYGCYETIADTILQYASADGANVLQYKICRNARKIATSVTSDYADAGYSAPCPAASAWLYIKRNGFNPLMPECRAPKELGGSSSTFARDAIYILAASGVVYGWLSLGELSTGLAGAGLSFASAGAGLSSAHWSFGGRLSANGSRGEYAALAA